ncbi:uncharacterized protein BDZ99DRAFT_102418 [Mytilinidion resinicola]|uniref:Uncharacterized protein n=1 Tax=Mytilinidion resinicola TaxID=574789 RepID=A0A6A6YBM7_9PEZI|nr:uncharacterized protein BDZ99DRAFT_102418 [Mytilinidion resinicola]KAF2806019.1 hypothetical protein BDZ99DRAFT_102418 [Mytilinidion resinicola]
MISCSDWFITLGARKWAFRGRDALTPAQPQLRLEHEQLSSLNGKGNYLGAHWDIVLPVSESEDSKSNYGDQLEYPGLTRPAIPEQPN